MNLLIEILEIFLNLNSISIYDYTFLYLSLFLMVNFGLLFLFLYCIVYFDDIIYKQSHCLRQDKDRFVVLLLSL
jgi:hypothetical protein